MTRSEHIAWAKSRAIEYALMGDCSGMLGSIGSDLLKHEETRNHLAPILGWQLMINNFLNTIPEMVSFVEGIQ